MEGPVSVPAGHKVWKVTIEAYLVVPEHSPDPAAWDGQGLLDELGAGSDSWWAESKKVVKVRVVENKHGARFLKVGKGKSKGRSTVHLIGPLPKRSLAGIPVTRFNASFREVPS